MPISSTSATFPLELSVIVPTYNERDNVPELFSRLIRALEGVAFEMIVVDDNSPDGTAAVAKSLSQADPRVRCLRRVGRRGLAGACIEGMLASAAPVVAVIDADLQHDETILPAMLAAIRADHDLVVGSRNIAGGSMDEGLSRFRRQVSNLGRKLTDFVLKAPLSDPMSGFFMIRRDLIEEIAPRLSTDGFKILADIVASLPNAPRVTEIAYTFRERLHGQSKLDARVALDFLGFVANKISAGIIPIRFVTFALVGATGLLVHLAALWSGLGFGLTFGKAQALATLVAMTSNFVINNAVTYRDARLRGTRFLVGLLLFYGVCSLGAVANVGVASWLYDGESEWWFAGVAGALLSAVWNYAASSAVVWRR